MSKPIQLFGHGPSAHGGLDIQRSAVARWIAVFASLMLSTCMLRAQEPYRDLTVAADGSGDFLTLTEAIQSLPMYTYERVVIFIRNGIYEEKVRIEQNHITLLGESMDSTIIQYAQLRSDWQKNKDHIGPAVINIHADDVELKNLTIINTQPEVGPHAFTIYGTGTRTLLYRCKVLSKGGDTVSLWNYKHGMYYHAECEFEGAVDFVCPRGWCYIRDSRFYELQQTASIWHAAVIDSTQRLVIRDCHFDGVDGFQLGRHHYEAEFILLNCTFSNRMANEPIYHVTYPDKPARNRPYFWGDRYYFAGCRKEGKGYDWYGDNLQKAKLKAEFLTAAWTFQGAWNPEDDRPLLPDAWRVDSADLWLFFDQPLTIRGRPTLMTKSGIRLVFAEGRGRTRLRFRAEKDLDKNDLEGHLQLDNGQILGNRAGLDVRSFPIYISLSP